MALLPQSESASDDLACMELLLMGDLEAIRPLIGRWEKRLLAFAYRYTQDTHTARDIVQEVFIRVCHRRKQFKAEHGFSAWAFTIAANLCKNRARWSRRHPEQSWEGSTNEAGIPMAESLVAAGASPRESAELNEQLAQLKQLVMALPHDLKTAILLHHYEGLSSTEIARIVGCSKRGVETRIYRAMRRLKRVGVDADRGSLMGKTPPVGTT